MISDIVENYADQKIDLADWLMPVSFGCRGSNEPTLTTDRRIQILRILSGKRFDRIWATP